MGLPGAGPSPRIKKTPGFIREFSFSMRPPGKDCLRKQPAGAFFAVLDCRHHLDVKTSRVWHWTVRVNPQQFVHGADQITRIYRPLGDLFADRSALRCDLCPVLQRDRNAWLTPGRFCFLRTSRGRMLAATYWATMTCDN